MSESTTPAVNGESGAAATTSPALQVERLLQVVALVAVGSLSGLVTLEIATPGRTFVVTTGGALAAAIVMSAVMAGARRRGSGRLTTWTACTVVGAFGAAGLAVVVSALYPGPEATRRTPVAGAIDAVTRGWSEIMQTPVPGDTTPRILVPLAITAWAATAGAVVVAERSRAGVRPLLPGIVAFVLAAVAAGRHQYSPLISGCAVLAGCGLFLAARAVQSDVRVVRARRGPVVDVRQVGLLAGIVVATVAAAAVVGPTLVFGRDDHAFDPRDHFVPPAIPSGATNPLDLVASRRMAGAVPMFTIESPGPVTTRLLSLDTFDGVRWTTSATYTRSSQNIELPRRSGVNRRNVRAEVTIDGLTGPWLPSIGDPTRVEGVSVFLDLESGSIVDVDGDASGARYTITADEIAPNLAVLRDRRTATSAEIPVASELPDGMPDELNQIADAALVNVAESAPPLTRALSLELYLRSNYTVDEEAVGAVSYGNLVRTLTVTRAGAPEEFAAAFAVLSRVAGMPSRLVVGFGPGVEVQPGVRQVRAGDVTVWPEIYFAGAGWVRFNPVPIEGGSVEQETQSEGVREGEEYLREEAENTPPPPVPPQQAPQTSDDSSGSSRWIPVAVVAGAVVLAGLVIGPIVVMTTKRRRTARRRRRAEPRHRVVGAWHDVLDRLVEIDGNRPATSSVEEVVAGAETLASGLAGMYEPVNRALYHEGDVTPGDADQAWRARDAFVTGVRRTHGPRANARRAVSTRSLRHTKEIVGS